MFSLVSSKERVISVDLGTSRMPLVNLYQRAAINLSHRLEGWKDKIISSVTHLSKENLRIGMEFCLKE